MIAPPELPGVTHRFVQVGALRLHCAEAGSGAPLLLLHGWPQHWYAWRHQIPALAQRHRVIALDLPGFGWSDAPQPLCNVERLAQDVIAFLDAMGLERVRLMGHDWGGWIGFLLCLQHPQRFERFMALNVFHPFHEVKGVRGLLPYWRFWYQWLIAGFPRTSQWLIRRRHGTVAFILWLELGHKHLPPEEAAWFIEPLREPAQARAGVQLYRHFVFHDFPRLLKGPHLGEVMHTPTLLLFGARDTAISTQLLEGYEQRAPNMRVEIVPGIRHFIMEEAPDLVTRRALAFFDDA